MTDEEYEKYQRERAEFLAVSKERAMIYWRQGDIGSAVTSILKDLEERPDTKPSPFLIGLGLMRLQQGDVWGVKDFIEGFR